MRDRSHTSPWLLLKNAFMELPNNATGLLVALTLTGLAASMVLAREATGRQVAQGAAYTRVYPAGVFRAPHPTIVATGWRDSP